MAAKSALREIHVPGWGENPSRQVRDKLPLSNTGHKEYIRCVRQSPDREGGAIAPVSLQLAAGQRIEFI